VNKKQTPNQLKKQDYPLGIKSSELILFRKLYFVLSAPRFGEKQAHIYHPLGL